MAFAQDFKSVDLALEWSKQLTALATGTLVLSGTFVKDLFNGSVGWIALLLVCWSLLILCILSGMLFMGALCSLVDRGKSASIYKQPSLTLAILHFASFVGALILFAIFSGLNLLAAQTTLL